MSEYTADLAREYTREFFTLAAPATTTVKGKRGPSVQFTYKLFAASQQARAELTLAAYEYLHLWLLDNA